MDTLRYTDSPPDTPPDISSDWNNISRAPPGQGRNPYTATPPVTTAALRLKEREGVKDTSLAHNTATLKHTDVVLETQLSVDTAPDSVPSYGGVGAQPHGTGLAGTESSLWESTMKKVPGGGSSAVTTQDKVTYSIARSGPLVFRPFDKLGPCEDQFRDTV